MRQRRSGYRGHIGNIAFHPTSTPPHPISTPQMGMSIPLLIAGLLHAFTLAGHMYGHTIVFGPGPNPSPGRLGDAALVGLAAHTFHDFGATRSHYRYYEGLSLICSVAEATLAAWLIALALTPAAVRAAAPALTVIACLGSAGVAAVSWGWFITPPAIATAIATVAVAVEVLRGGGGGKKAHGA